MKGLIFTYVMTYGGAAVALFNPFYGLLAYICFAIIKPESLWFWSVQPGNYSRIIAIAMLIGWAFQGFGDWRIGKAKWVIVALLGFWGCGVIGAVFAENQKFAWDFVESMTKIVLPVLVGITTIRTPRQLMQLAWVILLSQGYVAFEMNTAYYSGWKRMQFGTVGGLDNNGRAIAMNTAVGLAFFMGFKSREIWKKGLCWCLCVLMIHSILFSMSRGGMLALCITGGLAFVMIPKTPKHYIVLILALLVGYRLAGKEVTDRFQTTFAEKEQLDESAEVRLKMWSHCWDAMKANPVLGLGPGHWELHADNYGWPEGKAAHSLWMEIGAELGFPGLGFLLAFYGFCIVILWRQRKTISDDTDDWLPSVALMVISSLVGFVVSAQFVTVEAVEIPYYVALLGAAGLKLATAPQLEFVSHFSRYHTRSLVQRTIRPTV